MSALACSVMPTRFFMSSRFIFLLTGRLSVHIFPADHDHGGAAIAAMDGINQNLFSLIKA